MKANLRVENMEFRTCGEHLLSDEPHNTGEIVQWGDNESFCWVVAYWNHSNDGYELQFVGSRPFDKNVKVSTFWKLAKFGQDILDEEFIHEEF